MNPAATATATEKTANRFRKLLPIIRNLAVALIAGFAVSQPVGLLSRLYMRVAAIMSDSVPDFTWGGLFSIQLFAFLSAGSMSGIAYALLRRFSA
ncbi:hypothetical protein RB620_27770 [Paenibacillus sp. LHD-117]|uniref:hypothetical protein n=1 Tax=Paenibacillus sp. LHD-117 TaxID=3071412 RepID=UPI0027E05A8B|nr:hypothetical protein [Paenibacillus sp. LHD-117]MDQ6423233.1 hypothetical protein [Paenibacillus sp. LHD-117]